MRARKEHPPIAITLVVLYAIVFVFALPLIARALHLPTGVGGFNGSMDLALAWLIDDATKKAVIRPGYSDAV